VSIFIRFLLPHRVHMLSAMSGKRTDFSGERASLKANPVLEFLTLRGDCNQPKIPHCRPYRAQFPRAVRIEHPLAKELNVAAELSRGGFQNQIAEQGKASANAASPCGGQCGFCKSPTQQPGRQKSRATDQIVKTVSAQRTDANHHLGEQREFGPS